MLVVRPRGVVSLDEAHAAIEQWEFYSGKTLDEAQRLAVELMMGEGSDGRWAARTTGRAMPRQNGKGDEIEVVEAYGLTQRAEAIVHTAHEIPTAKSAHERMVAHFESHRDLRRKMRKPTYANGNQTIPMANDGIIVYRTRTAGGGRGLDDISRLVVDEAQHAHPEQLASSSPILGANPNPQLNLTGTSGISGKSDWWWTIRKRALEGDDIGFSFLEHSAERVELNRDGRVISESPDPDDRAAWALANPAYGLRLEESYLREELKVLGPALFAREHLGVWDPFVGDGGGVIPFDRWSDQADVGSKVAASLSYGLAVSPDGSWASVGSSGRRADHRLHVDVVRSERGTGWVVAHLSELFARRKVPVRVHPGASEGALIQELLDAKVDVVEVSPREYQQACGALLVAVENDGIRNLGQSEMDRAVSVADRRDVGKEGGWVWAQPSSGVDISPLRAATLALSGVVAARRPPRVF